MPGFGKTQATHWDFIFKLHLSPSSYAELYVEGHKVWHNILQYICGVKFKTKKLQVHVQSVRAYHETGGERYTRTLLREGITHFSFLVSGLGS